MAGYHQKAESSPKAWAISDFMAGTLLDRRI
jgi:hypothetical protein